MKLLKEVIYYIIGPFINKQKKIGERRHNGIFNNIFNIYDLFL